MQIRTLPAAAALLLFSLSNVTAQEHKGAVKAAADAGAAMQPKPGPEHQGLAKAEGTWDCVMEGADMPGTSKGSSEIKMSLNGFWLVEHLTCDMGGQKYEGHGQTGYDPIKGKYVSTWIDNMNPAMFVGEGTFDPKTMTMTTVGDSYDQAGQKIKMRNVTTHKDANTVVFEMFHTGADGKEKKVMTLTYTRHMPAHPAK